MSEQVDEKTRSQESWGAPKPLNAKQRNETGNITWNQGLEEFGDSYMKPGIMGERMGTHSIYEQHDM